MWLGLGTCLATGNKLTNRTPNIEQISQFAEICRTLLGMGESLTRSSNKPTVVKRTGGSAKKNL
jgi:hypothetical protein